MKLNEPLILMPHEVLEIVRQHVEATTLQTVSSVEIEGKFCIVRFKTKMATVWHVKKDKFANAMLGGELRFPLDYECVAKVASKNLEEIFELTNHIDHAWYENPGVECLIESRSTSVGDVIVMSDNRTLFLCLPAGWRQYYGVPQIFRTGLALTTEDDDDDGPRPEDVYYG